ncbi:MAG: ATP-dependent acyl-CoA ligase, partial [Alphaproteobacteria bacterium]|nr:ATP-dependent acyl-CoA ligase [Alphaproteobacteria bacterium]
MTLARRRADGLLPITLGQMMDARAGEDPAHVYCRRGEEVFTIGDIAARVNRFAHGLLALGLAAGDRVGVMLPNAPDTIVAFLAMVRLGLCQVPINVNLRGDALDYLFGHSQLKALVVDKRYEAQVLPSLKPDSARVLIVRGGMLDAAPMRQVDFARLPEGQPATPTPITTTPGDTILILYTSGTTGAPKGVLVSDRMLQAAAWAAAWLGDARPGDVFHFWEPIYHIGGAQILIVAMMERVTLAMVDRFSASSFMDEIRACGATHLHFLGGVVGLILKQPPSPLDTQHKLRVAWGGGCPQSLWRPFEERFGVPIHECYGMTEASSFTTVNRDGRLGSVGKPLPWFEVIIADENGRALPPGVRGEFRVREMEPGVITKGYFANDAATRATVVDGWLRTGDVGYTDEDGYFYYAGRTKDSLRRRGENISAWEVERVFTDHPAIAECAVIGIANEIADQDVKLVARLKPGMTVDPLDLIQWAEPRMPRFQIPRFVRFIDEFPKTPSERIRKEMLPKTTD